MPATLNDRSIRAAYAHLKTRVGSGAASLAREPARRTVQLDERDEALAKCRDGGDERT